MVLLAIQEPAALVPGGLIAALLDEALVRLDTDRDAARRYLERAGRLLNPMASTIHSGGLAPWQEKRVRAYIDANLGEQLRLSALAEEVRLSVSHFGRAFGKSFGETFVNHVAQRRIERAQALMDEASLGLSQIALVCGFADQPHFSRTFRRYVGVTPNQWRRDGRGDQRRELAA